MMELMGPLGVSLAYRGTPMGTDVRGVRLERSTEKALPRLRHRWCIPDHRWTWKIRSCHRGVSGAAAGAKLALMGRSAFLERSGWENGFQP